MDTATSLLYRDQPLYRAVEDQTRADLHIDQIERVVLEGLEKLGLEEEYRRRPVLPKDTAFRQDIARELEDPGLRGDIAAFLMDFARAKAFLLERDGSGDADVAGKWHLDAARTYCVAVDALCGGLSGRELLSEGLKRFARWLSGYAASEEYAGFREETVRLTERFASCRYSIELDFARNAAYIGEDEDTRDYYAGLLQTFGRFDHAAANRQIAGFPDTRLNSLERQIWRMLRPRLSGALGELRIYHERHTAFIHNALDGFEREAHFYLSYLAYADSLRAKGFPMAYPRLEDAETAIADGYDASLALLRGRPDAVVLNDFHAAPDERSLLLTGPNQGGKTTFSRMLGQIHFFAALGLPVPCRAARLQAFSGIATHFAAEEDPARNSGRLQEELHRLARVLRSVPRGSVVILNELFSSTTTLDALDMGREVLRMFGKKGCLCLYVTHIAELASLDSVVSLVAQSTEDEPPVCTYRILRDHPGVPALAGRLLKKYRLRGEDIGVRMGASFSSLL